MNIRMIAQILGRVLLIMAALLLLPFVTGLVYAENILPFAVTIALTAAVGGALLLLRPHSREIYAREGFAVVAEEIGHLANQSSDTVSGINEIVEEVHRSVDNMSACLSRAMEFVDKDVTADYDSFEQMAQQYADDAAKFEESMSSINGAVISLSGSIDEVSSSIQGINSTIGEAANGVTDIAQKTTDIVALTSETDQIADTTVAFVDEMRDVVKRFTLE